VAIVTTDAPAGPARLDDLAARADLAFRGVQERIFADDPAANGNLVVEAIEATAVDGVSTLVLVTPWTINGLVVPTDAAQEGPEEIVISGAARRAYRGDVAPLGVYWAVNLVPDVSQLTSPRQARALATSFAEPFRDGVRGWLAARVG
jgi:[NiFe]-hydrogenase assembly, chaperone, HybE